MTGYRVTYIHPTGRTESTEVGPEDLAKRVNTVDNRLVWAFNWHHEECPILNIEKCYSPSRDEITMGGRFSCE